MAEYKVNSYLVVRGADRGSTQAPATDGFCGRDKFVEFQDGYGVLDLLALHLERPDWVKNAAKHGEERELVQVAGETLGAYVRFFQRRGYTVTEITDEQAAEFRARIDLAREEAREVRATFATEAASLFVQQYEGLVTSRAAVEL
jgi:hypothetical protein